ncbi:RsmB/NOP family class I SAM-dependent RNA methyltransferase [Catenovulum adriaticum]|uniref:RsmB/NOP family class I SAM-dependent RNA methyltransferase n=1 Tax=Catenovulum adriaticum TaxID=2984846 RepID=A0ABY7AL56_9ALTE|nr:RsmB/NOP family class I SAM-dependent RNA methyltransferase [Catenovulum sp. TS8]WAJ69079.1 RsmB/NOP family class I SAM-dependent RNA methyltransferase [Catenovulum sp. TS8]
MSFNEKSHVNLLWRDWLKQAEKKPLDRWLKTWFKQNRHLSRSQKLDLSQAMFAAMRFLQTASFLDAHFENIQSETDVETWDKHWQIADLADLSSSRFWQWVNLLLEYHQLEQPDCLLNLQNQTYDELKTWFEQQVGKLAKEPAAKAMLYGIRPQWQPLLTQRSILNQWNDAEYQQFIAKQLVSPPLWLRLTQASQDKMGDTVKRLSEALNKQGVDAQLTEQGLCINGGQDITLTENYKQGEFEIQDLASQQIAEAVQVKPGQKIWDTCAGAGGKSLAIAAKMKNKGCVVATDLHEYKLAEVKKRAKRAGYFNIRTFAWNGEKPLKLPKEAAQQKGFDWVLIDAPCTSAGTWRRNPDAKWRFNESDTQQQLAIQQQILNQAHYAVRAGGCLVYATCSWQVSENEAQVADFLAKNKQFSLIKQQLLGAPYQNSDTMFVAVMQKA